MKKTGRPIVTIAKKKLLSEMVITKINLTLIKLYQKIFLTLEINLTN